VRIAHLIESDGPGGAERVVAHLANALQAEGDTNVVFVPAKGEGWLAQQLEGTGVAVEHFHIDQPLSLTCVRSLADAFVRHGIEVAHSHEFSMAVYGAWATRRVGIPHVITMHGSRYYADRLRRRLALASAMAMSQQIVAVSAPLAAQMSRDLWVRRSRISIVTNGVPWKAPERVTLREELGLESSDRLLVSVGNLYPVKGHRHMIDALALLAKQHPRLHYAIAGRGDQEEPLLALARDHGLQSRVHLLGLRNDVSAVLSAADIFVLPSISEGLPLALLEAMFAARPIVASNVGDIAIALAGGQAGRLVPPEAPAALAVAIGGLLQDPDAARLLGERAQLRVAAEYSLSQMVRQYARAYEAALRREVKPSGHLLAAGE